ncbi:unnamed protein product [Closterium sp. NIES-54]
MGYNTYMRFLATVVTDPSLSSTAASALVAELVDFAASCRLDYAASLVAESASVCPPSVGGECALSTDVLEDRQEEFQCFAAALPHLVSTLLAPEGDPDAPDIPTPRSYAEAIEGPYSSQFSYFVEGVCYLCVPPNPGIEAAALGASQSSLPSTALAEALHTFTLDSGASCYFFRDSTTVTPLPAPVLVRLANPSGGPVVARSSIVLPCPATSPRLQPPLLLLTPRRATAGSYVPSVPPRPLPSTPPSLDPSGLCSSALTYGAFAPCLVESAYCDYNKTLLWHHRLGHPSVPRLRGMHSRLLVSGLPRSLPPHLPSPAPPCLPCIEGRQRAAPHSSSFPPTSAPLQTLHMDVWGPAYVSGQGRERFFLLVVDDFMWYTTVFPLRSKGQRFLQDLRVLRLHSDRSGEFSFDPVRDFCDGEGIHQSFTLPDSPQQNGIAERCIGLVMEVARTSIIHAVAPHFLWPFAVQYAAHQLNLWPRVSLPETSPTLRWTGEVGDVSVFRVWGSRAYVCDMSVDKLSIRAIPCVFPRFPHDAPGWQFYHLTLHRVFPSQDVTFDESVSFYRLFSYRSAPPPPPLLFLAPGPPPVDPLPPQGSAPSGVSLVDLLLGTVLVESEGAGSGGAEPRGAEPRGAEPGVAETAGVEPGAPGPSAPATATAATAAIATATAVTATPACCATMASLRVLAFDHEGRPVQFDKWIDDLQLYLHSDFKDNVSLFDLASRAAPPPPATANTTSRSKWLTRDAAARLAIRNHLPLAEYAHFGLHRTAQALYDAEVTRYSSPATSALGRLLLPYLFPELSAFAIDEDLVSHLCTSDARYRTTFPGEILDRNQPPMFITLYFIVTRLPESLRSVRDHFLSLDPTSLTVDLLEQHLLAAKTSAVAVGSARGTPRPPFFEGSSPSPLAPHKPLLLLHTSLLLRTSGLLLLVQSAITARARVARVMEVDAMVVEVAAVEVVTGVGLVVGVVVGAAVEVVEAVEVVAAVGLVAGVGALVAAVEAAMGVAAVEAVGLLAVGLDLGVEALMVASGSSSSVGARPSRPSSSVSGCFSVGCLGVVIATRMSFARVSKLVRHAKSFTLSTAASPASTTPGVLRLVTTSSALARRICLGLGLLSSTKTMMVFFLSAKAEGDCYRCVPPDPGIAAAALGASESGTLPGTAHAEALHAFMLDSGALPCFFRESTTLTPLRAPVPYRCPPGCDGHYHHSWGSACVDLHMHTDGRHLATLTRWPGSSLYTLATEPPQVAVSAQVSASGQVAASCSCRLLSHQTLEWQHRMGHPSLPRLRGMHSCLLGRERFFLLVVDDFMWYTTVCPLRSKGQDLRVLRQHSNRGGEFSSNLLWDFCRGEGIHQTFTLPDSPQQNGIAECRIGLVMKVAHTSMIHAVAPHFLWPFAVQYAVHQLNLWPCVSLPETLPTLRWTGEVGDASVFRVCGSRAFVRDMSADKLSAHAVRNVFLGFVPGVPGWQFYHPTSRRVLPSQNVTFEESVPFYRLFPYRSAPPPPSPLFLAPSPPLVDPLPPHGPAPSGVSQVDPLPETAPLEVAIGSRAALGAVSWGAASGGAEPGGAEFEGAGSGGAEPRGEEVGGAEPAGVEPGVAESESVEPGGAKAEVAEYGGAEPRGAALSRGPAGASPRLCLQQLRDLLVWGALLRSGATGAGDAGAGGAGVNAEATGPGGARTRCTGAAGTGGVGGTRAGDPTEPRTARSGGSCAGGAGAGGVGVGGTGTGGAGAAGAGAVDSGA